MSWEDNAKNWKKFYPSSQLQADFFLLKFAKDGDVTPQNIKELMEQFNKFDRRKQGELEENEAMQIMEARHNTLTFVELRQKVKDIDLDQNRELSFLEWACFIYNKSWQTLHSPSVDPEEIKRAEELQAQAAAALAQAAADLEKYNQELAEAEALKNMTLEEREKAIAEKKRHEEEQERKKQEEEEKKQKEEAEKAAALSQSGVKGAAAMFHYAAKDTKDSTMDNATRIKAEAAARREAKRLEEEKKKKEEEAKIAEEEAAKKAEEAKRAAEEKAKVEEEARLAEEERKKAEAGSVAAAKEKEAFEKAKREAEEEEARKAEEEKKKREESRAKLAARAALFNAGAK